MMELEELMTNRALLEKMSEANVHTTFRKQPKHVVIQENHAKPKEVCIEYKNSHNTSGYYVENSVNQDQPPPPAVLEGYGCKCPNKLKQIIKIAWILILLLYIFGMPVVLLHLSSKLSSMKTKIGTLRHNLDEHLKTSKHEHKVTSSKIWTDERDGKPTSNKIPHEDFEKFYKETTNFETVVKMKLDNMADRVAKQERRLSLLKGIEIWLNKTLSNKTQAEDGKCMCLDVMYILGWLGKAEVVQPKSGEKCDCPVKHGTGMLGLRGPQGPRGPPGPAAVIDSEIIKKFPGLQGPPGEKGSKGETGSTGSVGKPGINGTCKGSCVTQKLTTIYTRWGKNTCPENTNATMVYNGYMGGSYHTHEGGGSNYLCLPQHPKYGKRDTRANADDRAYMYGVEFELGDSSLFDFDTSIKSDRCFDALCSVCEVHSRRNSLMIPATTQCPVGWTKEYQGFLMAQKKYLKRTEYICVDHQPDLTIGTEEWKKGAFLHFVETKCGVLPCNSGQYKQYWELSCVVCTK